VDRNPYDWPISRRSRFETKVGTQASLALIGLIVWFASWAGHDLGLPADFGFFPAPSEPVRRLLRKGPGPLRCASVVAEVFGLGLFVLAVISLASTPNNDLWTMATADWFFWGFGIVFAVWVIVVIAARLKRT
jgi:hypothetical protein